VVSWPRGMAWSVPGHPEQRRLGGRSGYDPHQPPAALHQEVDPRPPIVRSSPGTTRTGPKATSLRIPYGSR
jgi:hypothetical protein